MTHGIEQMLYSAYTHDDIHYILVDMTMGNPQGVWNSLLHYHDKLMYRRTLEEAPSQQQELLVLGVEENYRLPEESACRCG